MRPLPPATLAFVDWAARYALRAAGRGPGPGAARLRAPPPTPERLLRASGRPPGRATPARARVLAAAGEPVRASALAAAAQVSAGVVKGLVDDGALEVVLAASEAAFPDPDPDRPGAALNPSQAAAAAALTRQIAQGGFQAALLDGVTGSGKTEVYLEAIAHVLRADPAAQVLVLLPEIALTQAVIARIAERFGAEPAGVALRRVAPRGGGGCGRRSRRGVAGSWWAPRSALFLPFPHLALIVVDEEHDGSFKQEDGFVYHARDLAVARASIERCAVVLASATPSLESVWNARAGRYAWLRLTARHGAAQLPEVELLDLREHAPERGRWAVPAAGGRDGADPGARRAGPAVPEPAGLCAPGAVPRVRGADDRAGHR